MDPIPIISVCINIICHNFLLDTSNDRHVYFFIHFREMIHFSSSFFFSIFLFLKIIIGSVSPSPGPIELIVILKTMRMGEGHEDDLYHIASF
jgi:hypothetical protein